MSAIEMKVTGLMVDPLTNMPIVILKNEEGDRLLPIWIGPFEAQAIAMKREAIEPPRPMTHDLIHAILVQLSAKVEKVVISDLRDNTFYAILHVAAAGGGGRYEVDSRPSDAIALALRTQAPIFVEPVVLQRSAALDAESVPEESEQRLKKWFDDLDPEDLSNYRM